MVLRCKQSVLRCVIVSGGLLLALGSAACDIEDVYVYRDGGVAEETPPTTTPPPTTTQPTKMFDTESRILAHLDQKRLVMDAADIPSHPNGFDRNVNFGQASQCINRVVMTVSAGAFRVTTEIATLEGAPELEDVGVCDPNRPDGNTLTFDTTAAKIENVRDGGDCFDITLTYAGFGQEGRGSISADGKDVWLELFFRDQAIGHRCADGDVGAATVTLNQEPFRADAVQHYRVEED